MSIPRRSSFGEKANENENSMRVPFEVAIDKTGFGLYSYVISSLTGFLIISYSCISYGSMIIVPTSACELNTTVSQQGLLAAGPVIGLILGGLIWGYLADTRGRRSMLLVALLGGALVNMLASISVNWLMLLVLQFIASLLVSGIYLMSMTLLSESVPMAKRNLVIILINSIYMLSQGLMAVLAIPIIPLTFSFHLPILGIYWNSWRTLMFVYSLPSLLSAVWLFYMQDSPKFVFRKGDDERALEILKIIHRMNKPGSGELKVDSLKKEESLVTPKAGTASSAKDQILPLFKLPLLKYTLIMIILFIFEQIRSFVIWLPTIAHQFVTILRTGEGTNDTLCSIIKSSLNNPSANDLTPCSLDPFSLLLVVGVGVTTSLFNLVVTLIFDKVGRRNTVIALTAICGASGVMVNYVPNAIGSIVLFGVMLQGLIVHGFYTAIVVSIYPTKLRSMAVALPQTVGHIATFASIQILKLLLTYNCNAGFQLFCTLFASSAIVASFLPNDRRPQPSKHEVEKQDNHDESSR